MSAKELCQKISSYNPNNIPRKLNILLDKLITKEDGFNWIHAGTFALPIGKLKDFILQNNIKAARTGHLGNWQEIANGRAGALDHNGTSCVSNMAYPYLYDLNQTENNAMTSGDSVYLVGSLIINGKRKILDLYTWDGEGFVKRTRDSSYFVPFVMVEDNGQMTPLVKLQKLSCRATVGMTFHSDVFIDRKEKLIELLHRLISEIKYNSGSGLKLVDLFDRVVNINGSMQRVSATIKGDSFHIGELVYQSVDKLIADLLLPIQAAYDSAWFLKNVATLPESMPFMTLSFIYSLDYLFAETDDEFNLHFEWGAFGSAAYPPKSKGYFKDTARIVKKISKVAIKTDKKQKATFCLLLPSSIFNLLPSSAYPDDVALIRELFQQVLTATQAISNNDAGKVSIVIDAIVLLWWQRYESKISTYYLGRFALRRCVYQATATHTEAHPVFLDEFYQLTLQQACITVGALFSAAKVCKEVACEATA